MSAIQGTDGGEYSYLELVDFLERCGARPTEDIRQLWHRLLYSCAIGNTDDHMRNHGFLRTGMGWTLSPAFDVNPTEGDGEKYLSCTADFDERLAIPQTALDVCEEYRVTHREAVGIARRMAKTLAEWRRLAAMDGIAPSSVSRMERCFESAIERLRACK
jgi:serine/threonine-protein kinase HipA